MALTSYRHSDPGYCVVSFGSAGGILAVLTSLKSALVINVVPFVVISPSAS